MSKLQDDLTQAGYIPQIAYRNDGYAKVLYLKNLAGQDVRLTIAGGAYFPTTPLADQNPTLKGVSSGVMRVHLKSAGG